MRSPAAAARRGARVSRSGVSVAMMVEPAPEGSSRSSTRDQILAELIKFAEDKLADKTLKLMAEDASEGAQLRPP